MICISKVISQMHSLDIIEHVQLVCSDRVDQLNSVLRTFHQNCRHYTLIYPLNKFKDMNLPMRPTDKLYESLFDYKEWVKYNVLADLGFGLEIKQTSLKNPEIHEGVYLRVKDGGSLPIGSLIGFVPGYFEEKQMGSREIELTSKTMVRGNSFEFQVNEAIPFPYHNLPYETVKEKLERNK